LRQIFSEFDVEMTHRALTLAARGIGQVSPSPLVGCVIVSKNGEKVGEGFYVYENLIHAEALALEQAGARARGGTAYVSLEPHDHHGRTPPCTEALINAGIRRVVCPIEDPNPLVSGKGFARLINAGVKVVTGILANEAAELNEKFICWHQKGRPFVHFKAAVSLDGHIATGSGESKWISNEISRRRAHELRRDYDAILIGSNTALLDDPILTDRSGKPRRRPLARVVLDDRLRLPVHSRLVETAMEIPTIVFTNSADSEKIEELQKRKVEVVQTAKGSRNLENVLSELRRREIQSVLVEGGASVAGAFFDARLIDRATFFVAPLVIGGNDSPNAVGGRGSKTLADAFRLEKIKIFNHGEDLEITGLINN
jgi:diaminohydroxyphosphoribosylaminopyrimidine deaminase / 5-amino-6-(5-phosphoribosylamino)uracil reductase